MNVSVCMNFIVHVTCLCIFICLPFYRTPCFHLHMYTLTSVQHILKSVAYVKVTTFKG